MISYLKSLHFAHRVYMYVWYASQNEQPLFLYTASAVALRNGDAVFPVAAD
jgi:hypothetical protein